MKPRTLILAWPALALALVLSACAQFKESGNRLEESHLRDAGFKIMLADQKDRQQMLDSLPAGTITRLQHGDNVYYIYPDPDGCVCLYVGREAEYRKLQQLAVERQVSDQQLRYNDMQADYANGWNRWGNFGVNGNYSGRPSWDPY